MNYPHTRRLVLALAFFLVVLAAPLTVTAKDNWISVRSKNFLLVGNGSEKEIRQVATRLEQFRDVFTRLMPNAKLETPVPTTVIVFKSLSSYKPFNTGNNAGYFQKGEDVNYITLTTDLSAQDPFSVIYHEYVHLLIDNTSGNVPVWFNEGLAEYYSTFGIQEDRKVRLGELHPYHLDTLRAEKLLPLRTLFAVDPYSPYYNEGSKRGMFYAESWALVHYLIQSNSGQRLPQLAKFLELIKADRPIEDAFKQAFQIEVEVLEKELKKYVAGHTFKMHVATFERKLEFDNELKVAPLTEAEAQAYLGDLLLHTNRFSDAEPRLQQALTLDPKLTLGQTSLGILRARQGRFEEARTMLKQAVAGNSNNYLAHFYYAYALSREGMDSDNVVRSYPPDTVAIMRTHLSKAIELSPAFPESYSLLAFVNMVTGEELDRSTDLLTKAMVLAPGRQDLGFMLAQIYMRQERLDLARQALESLRKAKDRQMRQKAENLLASIKDHEEQLARYRAELGDSATGPSLRRREAATAENSQPPTPSELLRQKLGPVEPGQERIQGWFNRLECDDSGTAYFVVQTSERLYKLRASDVTKVRLTTYTPVERTLRCGVRQTPENVVVTFHPAKDPKDVKNRIDGDVIAVDLVPKEFQLKQ